MYNLRERVKIIRIKAVRSNSVARLQKKQETTNDEMNRWLRHMVSYHLRHFL